MRVLALLLAAVLLAGCALFTKPTGNITIERQEFINAWAVTKVLYQRLRTQAERYCRTRPPEEALRLDGLNCGELADIDRKAKVIAIQVDAKIAVPESELDYETIKELLGILVGLIP